jgi:Mn2+/Fe2+ NRAMP family transporter
VETSAAAAVTSFRKAFGPGLLWAAAAIGVSHLVQSTRAGAMAGFSLAWVILLALLLKYPFFEFGPRYAAATGESLVEGYLRLGRWALWVYVTVTVSTALIIQVTVVLFTAFLFAHVLGVNWSPAMAGGAVMALCGSLLAFGRFRALDLAVKAVLLLLAVSTLAAAAMVLPRTEAASLVPWPLALEADAVRFAFLLALVGWMPSAIDISVWSSLWTLAKGRATGARSSVRSALLDFRIGYFGTALVAFAFLMLGAGVMHASGEEFSPSGTVFSLQLVDLYAATLGAWSRPLVLVAVLTTMFSTTLTVMDGFPRAIARSVQVLRSGLPAGSPVDAASALAEERLEPSYWLAIVTLGLLTLLVLQLFVGNLTAMVDFATIVAFLTAPVLGYLNLRAVTAEHVPRAHQPGAGLRLLSHVGLALLGGTTVVYLALPLAG